MDISGRHRADGTLSESAVSYLYHRRCEKVDIENSEAPFSGLLHDGEVSPRRPNSETSLVLRGRRLVLLFTPSRVHLAAVLLVIGQVVFCITEARPEAAPNEVLDAAPVADRLSLAIPAQPLEDALMAYAKATGVEVFVDHALVVGRRSGLVQGVFSFEAALQQMLAGSGLDIRQAAPRAYTLVAMPLREPPSDRAPGWSADQTRSRFFAAVQAAVKQILCTQPGIVPGQYRAALAIWTDPAGRVVEARLLGASVDVQVAHRLLDGIKGVSVGQPPPAGLEQPVTFVVLPRRPDQTGDCASPKADRR